MQTLHVTHPLKNNEIPQQNTVLIMGFFDGVHKGHQQVIKTGVDLAKKNGLKSVLITFDRSPRVVYQHVQNFKYLSTEARKQELIQQLGVDYLYFVEFTEDFATLKPQEFVDEYMIGMHAKFVVAGFDYTYGKRDIANMDTLPKYSKNKFQIVTVPKQTFDEEKIGSSSIKEMIEDNNIDEANELLGYDYQNSGTVVHGLQRGRTLGFPTANLSVGKGELIPSIGVYATRILVNGKWYDSMTSVGYNITFAENTGVTVECNIFDFDEDIYGNEVTLQWVHYLRGEIKFSGADELIDQLKKDRENSKSFLFDK
ncbi:riboflavin biosynthesis protein RibF [Companilactobacillus ginsenosidimutans]|uniref:Riboflavin biosynthesis protein n=1 Tax=Companilactobacillus ginsenosidimutans TaxID=1007676 RepID=A0A0H4QMN3_9LACO|nr:riboflavin biosynthesis protein RibF [Companilactobacillus ginsenosidimutans]AKP68386.1 riboflavin biosynthesis protein RibF [Companilactobacillus ginsenosidimutans]